MWEQWPKQRIGARAYMRSTYDRTGGNDDASHFLFQLADDFNVTLDVAGPGVLYFARYNHWHGSPWHYVVDGSDHVLSETSTRDPGRPVDGSVFLPTAALPSPLAFTWSTTMGADLTWVPVGFEKSFRMAYGRTHYGTGYYIYDNYVGGAPLSQPITAWDALTPPGADVLALIGRAGTDIAPEPGTPEGERVGIYKREGRVASVGPGNAETLLDVQDGRAATVRALEFSVPRGNAVDFGRMRLRVTWDGMPHPSIDAPVALFFGSGTLYNRDDREYLVKAFPVGIRFDAGRVHLACYFPMPFFRSARIELVGNGSTQVEDIRWGVRLEPLLEAPNRLGYFHATYRDHGLPERGRDLVLLDTRKAEGGGDWSGSFVGTSFIFSDRANLETLEGDPRFFFDDSRSPQAQGTGTEEWCGGGDYWGGRNMTLPFAGHPVGARSPASARSPEDRIESAYRFLLADMMPFGKNALICLEHGGTDESSEHYQSVTYWYGIPSPSLIKTDRLKVGDPSDERAHQYRSPGASAPYPITSRYELGVDHESGPGSREVFPAETDYGRKTAGSSEFTLRLDPGNLGVLLRRKLDYGFPNQRAEVFVAADQGGEPDWKPAGIWYLAGSNTCVYSNPKAELGAAQHAVQTSNRRFRDDEFLIPRTLTSGRASIRVKVRFTPVSIPLYPGYPLAELAWSEIRYDAYCFVMPDWRPGP
jgi:D-arabinan exo alpha-(1,3)/(1,5)-arabinofuranosidase (non-reducing end)